MENQDTLTAGGENENIESNNEGNSIASQIEYYIEKLTVLTPEDDTERKRQVLRQIMDYLEYASSHAQDIDDIDAIEKLIDICESEKIASDRTTREYLDAARQNNANAKIRIVS